MFLILLISDSFQVNLADGMTPNVGTVEVAYDGTWYDVCHNDDKLTLVWSFHNAQVVCKDLGFPGTMMQKKGGLEEESSRQTYVDSYKCLKGKIVFIILWTWWM